MADRDLTLQFSSGRCRMSSKLDIQIESDCTVYVKLLKKEVYVFTHILVCEI